MHWLQDIPQDVRFTLRLFAKERWFTLAAIGALALGHRRDEHDGHHHQRLQPSRIAGRRSGAAPVSRHARRDGPGARRLLSRLSGLARLAQLRRARGVRPAHDDHQRSRPVARQSGRRLRFLRRVRHPRREHRCLDAVLSRATIGSGAPPVVILGHRLWVSRYGARSADHRTVRRGERRAGDRRRRDA